MAHKKVFILDSKEVRTGEFSGSLFPKNWRSAGSTVVTDSPPVCSFLWSHNRLYTIVFHICSSTPQGLQTEKQSILCVILCVISIYITVSKGSKYFFHLVLQQLNTEFISKLQSYLQIPATRPIIYTVWSFMKHNCNCCLTPHSDTAALYRNTVPSFACDVHWLF